MHILHDELVCCKLHIAISIFIVFCKLVYVLICDF
jgi:hypothetical protein